MKHRRNYVISDFYCTECGFHTTAPRLKHKMRSKGHKKKIYCPCCEEEKNFKEIRVFDVEFFSNDFN